MRDPSKPNRWVQCCILATLIGLAAGTSAMAQCEQVVNLFATNVLDNCLWDRHGQAVGNPGAPSDCDTANDGATPYAIQQFETRGCDDDICDFDEQSCSCPGSGPEGVTPPDCRCLLRANEFDPFTLPAGRAIRRVEVDVQARYSQGCGNNSTIRVRVRLDGTDYIIQQSFSSPDGLCRYRLGGNGNVTHQFGRTDDPRLGGLAWTEQDINNLRVAVGRIGSESETALRVNAFRIRVTLCEDGNNDQVCDFCGDGVLNAACGEQCDGGDCCTGSCTFQPTIPSSAAVRTTRTTAKPMPTCCDGNSARVPQQPTRKFDCRLSRGGQCRAASGDCDL